MIRSNGRIVAPPETQDNLNILVLTKEFP